MSPEFRANESHVSAEERAFERWFRQVQKSLPNADEGEAYDLFADGCSVEEAVYELQN